MIILLLKYFWFFPVDLFRSELVHLEPFTRETQPAYHSSYWPKYRLSRLSRAESRCSARHVPPGCGGQRGGVLVVHKMAAGVVVGVSIAFLW